MIYILSTLLVTLAGLWAFLRYWFIRLIIRGEAIFDYGKGIEVAAYRRFNTGRLSLHAENPLTLSFSNHSKAVVAISPRRQGEYDIQIDVDVNRETQHAVLRVFFTWPEAWVNAGRKIFMVKPDCNCGGGE